MIARTLLASVIAIVVACGAMGGALARQASPAASPGASPSACAPATDQDLERIARAWSEDVINSGDASRLGDLISPDIVHHGASIDDMSDAATLEAGLQQMLDAFPGVTHTVEFVVADAPYVASRWSAVGTQTGEFMGIPATGATVTWEGNNLFRVECGQIVESWSEVDQVGRMEQMIGSAPMATPAAAPPVGTPAACAPTAPDQAETAVRAWFAQGWDAGDAAALDAITADDLIHHWAIGPDSVGSDALLQRSEAWRASMPDMATTIDVLVVGDGSAAARWTTRGTQTGEYMGAAPSGEATEWTGINLYRFCGGEIAEVWSEMDTANVLARFGLSAATPVP